MLAVRVTAAAPFTIRGLAQVGSNVYKGMVWRSSTADTNLQARLFIPLVLKNQTR